MTEHEAPWHEEVLPDGWLTAAAELSRCGAGGSFYLAGGTALALRLGHRISVDLDLFSPVHAEAAGVQLSFPRYPYPLLFETRLFNGLPVADVRDIACMKLDALSSRGTRRDFIDLYFVLRQFAMPELLQWFDRKYAAAAPNRVHLAKALTYFADAEHEPMPRMLHDVDWQQVRTLFESEARRQIHW